MTPRSPGEPPRSSCLDDLTGVRTGKRSFYPEYMRGAERMARTVQALDGICRALVQTTEGPRPLVEAVVRAAAEHLQAEWLLFAVADGALQAARPRALLLTGGTLLDDEQTFPSYVADQLLILRHRPWEAERQIPNDPRIRVVMTLDGEPLGGLAACPGPELEVVDTDLAILHVLANQAAVALHNTFLIHAVTEWQGRAQQLTAAAAQQAKDLAGRSAELVSVQRQLAGAMQRQVLDDERHRIARELHDSVAQDVLSAGIIIDLCRSEVGSAGKSGKLAEQLDEAKELSRRAVERLRASIYALYHTAGEGPGSLPALLERLCTIHASHGPETALTIRGNPVALSGEAEHALLRIAGEALFNVARHSNATRCEVRLHHRHDRVVLTVSDNGDGDPVELRRKLSGTTCSGEASQHFGLASMAARVRQCGGRLSIRRSRIGGIMLHLEIPVRPLGSTGGAGEPER